jgi:hypothetical protein
MLVLTNFLMLVVLPIVTMTAIISLFRWWMKRSTGYDPVGNKGNLHRGQDSHYAPYLPPKWREVEKNEAEKSSD